MKILVIGGTKFIGKAIVKSLIDSSHDVILFNRLQTQPSMNLKTIKGDVENIRSFKEEILKHEFDIAVHCIAYTEKHAEDLRFIFKNTTTKLVVLSSCDCYEAFQGLNRNIDKAELAIREESPLSKMKYYWSDLKIKGESANRYDKNLMTDILIDGHRKKELNVTVFRLPLVYGPGDYQYPGRHGSIIKRILDRKIDIVFSDREQCQVYTYGYIENISAAIIHSFDKNICDGKIYNIGDDQSRTRRKWAELYAENAGWKFQCHILPEELIRKDKFYRNAPPQHLLTDNTLFQREAVFKNPIKIDEAIQKTFEYAKSNPEVLGKSEDYEKESRLLACYYKHIDLIHNEVIL